MKKLILLFFVLFLLSCASVRVVTDYDRDANFEEYKTFNFTDEKTDSLLTQLDRNRIIETITNEMILKGFEMSDTPDVIVDFDVRKKITTTADHMVSGYGGSYYYRGIRGRYIVVPNNMYSVESTYHDHIEGILIISIIDIKDEQLKWRSTGTSVISEKIKTPEKREKRIYKAVTKIFEGYPPNE